MKYKVRPFSERGLGNVKWGQREGGRAGRRNGK